MREDGKVKKEEEVKRSRKSCDVFRANCNEEKETNCKEKTQMIQIASFNLQFNLNATFILMDFHERLSKACGNV